MSKRIRFFNAKVNVVPYVGAAQYGFPDLIIGLVDDDGKPATNVTIDDIFKAIDELEEGTFMTMMGLPIISNTELYYGAINAIKSKELLEKQFPDGYYLIPSSIHEMIVLPKGEVDMDGFNDFIKTVNSDVLDPEDILSDHYYEF